ncbi:hypothetical protein CBR_g30479 [Chara braunii]|uniref:Uncharacterized protein n=1 Tax=Chara braunii TaxID=69332 RepID=A0A388LD33_CHABU|nr:hypothetical protein CBR_g30479 [Chara braunii]|eukprot:GBG80112.1 hypothetical protein CBR_g30479 [Chara braunii]
MEHTPGQEGTGRSPPPGPVEERDYWEDEDSRIRSLLTMCFDDGVYPTEIDPGEMVVQGRELRFKLNTSLDEIKVKWLKEHTVTVIYKEAARFLAKHIKDDLVRAFEDGWIIGNSNLQENTRRGRLKIEGPGVASYVAKAREVAEYMKTEGQVEVTLGADTYRILFKPWMTRTEFRELRRQEEDKMFWVMALQVPLYDMPFIYAQIERAIEKIILAHPTDADPSRPALVNARFDLELEARPNMKDVLWVDTAKGDVLEIKLASAESLKCRKCMVGGTHAEQLPGGQNIGGGLGYLGIPQLVGGQNGQTTMWQGGAVADWMLANGVHPAVWQGMLGGLGMILAQGQGGAGVQQGWGCPSGIPNPQGDQQQSMGSRLPLRPQPLFGARPEDEAGRSRQEDRRAESSHGRSKSRTPGKQRRLITASQLELTPEPSGESRLSRSGSEKSIA